VVDPDRTEAADPHRLHHLPQHVAAGGDRNDLDAALAALGLRVANHLPVHDGLLERHRDVVLGLEADRGLQLVAVLDCGQPHAAHGDPLVGDAETD
jgi:hypothetical protein